MIKAFIQDESGQDIVEYAMLAGFISLVAVIAVSQVGGGVLRLWNGVDASVASIPTPVAP